MISLPALAELAASNPEALAHPVAPIRLGQRVVDSDETPLVMGVVNLSRASSYRDSVATSTASAVRRGRLLAAQGADVVDLGAESTTDEAPRVALEQQADLLAPVVTGLADDGVVVSAEAYHPLVAKACLEAGAAVLNYTGHEHDDEVFGLVADHAATLVLCSVHGSDAREVTDVEQEGDPIPGYLAHFEGRVAHARACGVDQIVLDPGLGFYYGNLVDSQARIEYQTRVLMRSFELRALGLPVCHALPHAFHLFEEQFRSAEPFFAVWARLGGAGMVRTHEVASVRVVLDTMQRLSVR